MTDDCFLLSFIISQDCALTDAARSDAFQEPDGYFLCQPYPVCRAVKPVSAAVHLTRKHDGVRTDRYKLIHFYGRGGTRAQQENKYQRMPGTREYNSFQWMVKDGYIVDAPDIDYMELYDLRNDPLELHNVYGQKGYEKITRQLQRELDRYRRELQIDEY